MKVQIRRGTFETNSSSTHSLSLCTGLELEKFKAGRLVYNYEDEVLIPVDLVDEKYEKECGYKIYYTYEEFQGYVNDYETFIYVDTLSNGETVAAIGFYGYDG